MTQFIAKFGYAQDDGEVLMAGLADDQFETKDYILFQKTCNPSADDLAHGHEQIHTTVSSRGSAYGGVEAIELYSDHLKLKVEIATAKALGTDTEILVSFDPNLESIEQIAEALKLIAGNIYLDRRHM